jgi:predicted O-methyltransferase YrrM
MINKIQFKYRKWKERRDLQSQLTQLSKEEIPDYVVGVFRYLIDQKVSSDDKKKIAHIEELRHGIIDQARNMKIFYSPLPESSGTEASANLRPEPGELKEFDPHKVAYKASITKYWGTFLYLLAKGHQSRNMIELGSCAGISGSYLVSSPFCERFDTIEGSKDLARIAQHNIQSIYPGAKIHNMLFDDALDIILPKLEYKYDLVWIDGHHEKVATIHYFQRLIPYLAENAIILFDDIYWSDDMKEAWEELSQWKGFSHTFNIKSEKGLGIWIGGNANPKRYNFTSGVKTTSVPHGWKS